MDDKTLASELLQDAEKYYMWKKQMDYDIFNIVESQK